MTNRFGNYILAVAYPEQSDNIRFIRFDDPTGENSFDLILNSSTESDDGFYILYSDNIPEEFVSEMMLAANRFVKSVFMSSLHSNKPVIDTTYPITGDMYTDRPIFQHYYAYPNIGHHGGITIATMYDKHSDAYMFGFSVCHQKDTYVKKLGNEYSWLDLNENQFIIPVGDFAKYAVRGPATISKDYSITVNNPVEFIRSCNPRILASSIGLYINEQEGIVNLPSKVISLLSAHRFYPRKDIIGRRY